MDVRKKLVEQLREVASKTPPICRYDNPDEIEHFGKTITVYCKPFEQFQELMRDAADYIAHSVTVQEWISVTERLPEKGEEVLVFDTRENWIGFAWLRPDETWTALGFDFPFDSGEVTHWMPLPEPPEEVTV